MNVEDMTGMVRSYNMLSIAYDRGRIYIYNLLPAEGRREVVYASPPTPRRMVYMYYIIRVCLLYSYRSRLFLLNFNPLPKQDTHVSWKEGDAIVGGAYGDGTNVSFT